MQVCSILLVDDDPAFRVLVKKLLQRWKSDGGYQLLVAEDLPSARRLLKSTSYHVIFLDLSFHGHRDAGFKLLEEIRAAGAASEIVVMSSSSSFESVQKAMRLGANDYLLKGFSPAEFLHTLEQSLSRSRWRGMEKRLLNESSRDLIRYQLIGSSSQMQVLRASIKKLAGTDVPILIEAETGTGKELVARNLHLQGADPSAPFVPVDCGAIPTSMAESILFGHEKGSFTGADATRIGVFEEAAGGTLFLDEISSLSLEMQNKLLRAIQEREIRRVGGGKVIPVSFRLITAANRQIERLVEEGKFKQDLFFRINVIQISLPPLRERLSDLDELVKSFAPEKKISEKLFSLFRSYSWPGNIRELKNMVTACVVMAGEKSEVELSDLPESAMRRFLSKLGNIPDSASSVNWQQKLKQAMAETEREVLAALYFAAKGNVSEAARILQMDRSHLHQKLVQLKIHEPRT